MGERIRREILVTSYFNLNSNEKLLVEKLVEANYRQYSAQICARLSGL